MAHPGFDLTGKVALVTGGNSGIGLGMAEGLARAGASVCVWGTNEDKNAAALKQLQSYGGKAMAVRCDVADEAAVERAFADTVSAFGRVDACFANAGVSGRGGAAGFANMATAEWRRVMSVNLDGAFFTLRTAARHMIERGGGGSLAVTSSLSAMMGAPRSQHYAATKGAVISLMRALAVELARHQVRVNAIVPGWIDTPMTERPCTARPSPRRCCRESPLRRWGVGEDFSGIAVYLASDLSAYHTGDTLVLDGGYVLF